MDREQRELYRLTIRLSDTLHTTDISQILLVGFPYTGLAAILVSSVADPGTGAFLTPGPGIGFPDPGSQIPDPKPIFLRA